jgi:uncharacterized protein (DUF2147 family)
MRQVLRFLARQERTDILVTIFGRSNLGASMCVVLFGLVVACVFVEPAAAAEPWGEWLAADKTAEIRVAECGGALWGVVAWEADAGIDDKNPDPRKRSRPTFGMPVLLGMKASGPNRWDGALYNSENGKTYSGGVSMLSPDLLRVRGCILGILCGGETWTRVEPTRPGTLALSDAALCARLAEAP